MIGLTYRKPESDTTTTITLVKDNGKPTPLLVGLAAAELALDVVVLRAVVKVCKLVLRR